MRVGTMFRVVVAVLLFSIAWAIDSAQAGEGKHPAALPELEALEFLIGDWKLTTSFSQADGSSREEKARLVARYALGGFGVSVEETHGYEDGVGSSFVSGVLYSVHPETRRIVGASNNTLGNRKLYEVTVEDEGVAMVQSGELFDGREGFNRHLFFNIEADRYEFRLDACTRDGDCREGTYSYVAERRDTPGD